MHLLVDADMTAVLRQCVHRNGWTSVFESLQSLADIEKVEQKRLGGDGDNEADLWEELESLLGSITSGRAWGQRG